MVVVEYVFVYSHHYLHYSLKTPTYRVVFRVVLTRIYCFSRFCEEITLGQVELSGAAMCLTSSGCITLCAFFSSMLMVLRI